MRTCRKCGRTDTEFSPQRRICKDCRRAEIREWKRRKQPSPEAKRARKQEKRRAQIQDWKLNGKPCGACGERKSLDQYYRLPDGVLGPKFTSRCRECTTQYYRDNKGRISARRQVRKSENPLRELAHDFVKIAIRRGYLIRPDNCSQCGLKCTPDGHHADYHRPLDVVWLCRSCHKKLHANDTSTKSVT